MVFFLIQESDVYGQWYYEMAVYVNRTEYGRGKGLSKKVAEQSAAR